MYQRDTEPKTGQTDPLGKTPHGGANDITSWLRGMSYEAQVQALSPSSQAAAGFGACVTGNGPPGEAAASQHRTGGPGSGTLAKASKSFRGAREGLEDPYASLRASVGLPNQVAEVGTLQQPLASRAGGDSGGAVLAVRMTVTENITNESGTVIGMRGTQPIVYTHSDGRTIARTYEVNWQEDGVVENTAVPYEHPAAPEEFNIIPKVGGQKYPVNTDHSEQGIAIHAPGRSEGCILADQKLIVNDLEARLNARVPMTGAITSVTDNRSATDKLAAPVVS